MRLWVSIVALILLGCIPIEPPVSLDADGEPIALPPAGEAWLRIESISPSSRVISTKPVLEIVFSDYLEARPYQVFSSISLQSGGMRAAGKLEYEMVSRTLRWQPYRELEPGIEYKLVIEPHALHSFAGAPLLLPPILPYYMTEQLSEDDDLEQPREVGKLVVWSEIETIVEKKCAVCHRDPQWQLNPLTLNSLVGQMSSQVERLLVRPYDAPASYLMHKILPSYASRRFTVQPPPWFSGSVPLTHEELLKIEKWINLGAH